MKFTVGAILIFLSFHAFGQLLYNLRHLAGAGNDALYTSAVDSQGNTYVSFHLAGSSDEIYHVLGENLTANELGTGYDYSILMKLARDGSVIWRKSYYGYIQGIDFDKNDNIYVAARYQSYSLKIAKLDPDGNELWKVTEGSSGGFGGLDILVDDEGNSYVTGNALTWSLFGLTFHTQGCCSDHDFLVKFNADGVRQWAIASTPDSDTNGVELQFDKDGNIILGGQYKYRMQLGGYTLANNIGYTNAYIAKVSPTSGAVMWLKSLGGNAGHCSLNDLKVDADGSIYVTGGFTGTSIFGNQTLQSKGGYDLYYAKLDDAGNTTWLSSDGNVGNDYGSTIEFSDEYLYASGTLSGNINLDNAQLGYIIGSTGFVSRFRKTDGKASWIKGYSGHPTEESGGYKLHRIDSKHLRVLGSFYGNISGYDTTLSSRARDLFIGEIIDTLFSEPGVKLEGKVFLSENSNCNVNQAGLKNIIIKAEPSGTYALTNADGRYQMKLQPGTYTIRQVLPEKRGLEFVQTCPAEDPQVVITTLADSPPPVNFGNTIQKKPHLEVDVISGRFRRCFENDVVVQYCNVGFESATNVVLTVDFPEYVEALSSSIPWTEKKGKRLIFSFTSVPSAFCQQIIIKSSVICGDENIRGLTQCVTAVITPLNDIEPDPQWDQSQIVLDAKCLENGFVRLAMKNIGQGSMADSAKFQIYADDALAYQHSYKLSSHDSLILQLPANGMTIRMEAHTTPNSTQSSLRVTLEGCGSASGGIVSKGFVNAFSQRDSDAEVETFCDAIVDSYDPNDKQVMPAGVTSKYRIDGTDELEYVIRFQNTGTDVAHNVVITDELDESLDIATLNFGATSHHASVDISGTGRPVLTWRFKNIMLPDSGANEAESHGFVKFKIKPFGNLAKETVIRNKAAIVFDFNSPIFTNEVFNTIGLPDPSSTSALTVQNCADNVSVYAGTDQNLVVCDTASIEITLPKTDGYRNWTVQNALSVQAADSNLILNLSEGENTLKYFVTHCNNIDSSTVRVRRVTTTKPSFRGNTLWCSNELQDAKIAAEGNIIWYSDSALTNKIFEGNDFVPTATAELYITDQLWGCKSEPTQVNIIVRQQPSAPVVAATQGCTGIETLLSANGTNLLWYKEPLDDLPLFAGDTYKVRFDVEGDYVVYVSQSVDGCISEKAALPLTIKDYKKEESFVANIITPNGDGLNDFFYLPPENLENCLGDFRRVTIYNRFGKIVFTSDTREFSWDAEHTSSGIYFYYIKFGLQKFQGIITVAKE